MYEGYEGPHEGGPARGQQRALELQGGLADDSRRLGHHLPGLGALRPDDDRGEEMFGLTIRGVLALRSR